MSFSNFTAISSSNLEARRVYTAWARWSRPWPKPHMTFGGEDLYPTIVEKAAALGFSLIRNHPFVDGNKRAGHAAMEIFLVLNGYEIDASVDEQEQIILQLAAGKLERKAFTEWLRAHVGERAAA